VLKGKKLLHAAVFLRNLHRKKKKKKGYGHVSDREGGWGGEFASSGEKKRLVNLSSTMGEGVVQEGRRSGAPHLLPRGEGKKRKVRRD